MISNSLWVSRLLHCCCCFTNCWINTDLSRSAYSVIGTTVRLNMGKRKQQHSYAVSAVWVSASGPVEGSEQEKRKGRTVMMRKMQSYCRFVSYRTVQHDPVLLRDVKPLNLLLFSLLSCLYEHVVLSLEENPALITAHVSAETLSRTSEITV